MEPEYHSSIFKKLCAAINALSPPQRETIQCFPSQARGQQEEGAMEEGRGCVGERRQAGRSQNLIPERVLSVG
eukprot:830153-Rhodomonas_salina.1